MIYQILTVYIQESSFLRCKLDKNKVHGINGVHNMKSQQGNTKESIVYYCPNFVENHLGGGYKTLCQRLKLSPKHV